MVRSANEKNAKVESKSMRTESTKCSSNCTFSDETKSPYYNYYGRRSWDTARIHARGSRDRTSTPAAVPCGTHAGGATPCEPICSSKNLNLDPCRTFQVTQSTGRTYAVSVMTGFLRTCMPGSGRMGWIGVPCKASPAKPQAALGFAIRPEVKVANQHGWPRRTRC